MPVMSPGRHRCWSGPGTRASPSTLREICASGGGRNGATPRATRVTYIGARVKRGDDPRLLTGRGRYVDDLTLPRMVHVAFVRSAHAHARLARVALDAARRAPGVVGVLTGDDVARLCKPYRGVLLHYKGMKTGAMLPLAVGRVRYVGEPIVALAAESRAAAEDAAALVDVECEPLPPVLTPAAALAPDAPLIHPELGDNLLYETRLSAGDPEGAFAAAHRVWTRTFTTGRHTGVPLEPRGLVADYEPATRALTVWISTQVPHMMQAVLAELFGLPEHRLRVIAPDVGRQLRDQDPRLPGRHGRVRDGADAGPSREVRRRPARVLPVRHPRPRADHPGRRGGGPRRRPDGDARLDRSGGRPLLGLSALERGGRRPGAPPPAGPVSRATLRWRLARRRAEQGRHLAVPRRGASDRRRGHREHGRAHRPRSRDRSRRASPPQSRTPRGLPVHDRVRQRLRQRQLPRRARATPGGRGVRPPPARAGGGPRARDGTSGSDSRASSN